MSSFGKWVAGIVAAVLTTVLATLIISWLNGPGPGSADRPPAEAGARAPASTSDEPAEIFLNRDSGPAGIRVRVSGQGFAASEKVTLAFHTEQVARFSVDQQGHFADVSVRVPKDWHFTGAFDFIATGASSVRTATRPFRVT